MEAEISCIGWALALGFSHINRVTPGRIKIRKQPRRSNRKLENFIGLLEESFCAIRSITSGMGGMNLPTGYRASNLYIGSLSKKHQHFAR